MARPAQTSTRSEPTRLSEPGQLPRPARLSESEQQGRWEHETYMLQKGQPLQKVCFIESHPGRRTTQVIPTESRQNVALTVAFGLTKRGDLTDRSSRGISAGLRAEGEGRGGEGQIGRYLTLGAQRGFHWPSYYLAGGIRLDAV
jgi:hypothetical protein